MSSPGGKYFLDAKEIISKFERNFTQRFETLPFGLST